MKLKSNILFIGIIVSLIFGCVAYSMTNTTKDEPIIGPVHENDTIAKVKAIKKIPMDPPIFVALSSIFS